MKIVRLAALLFTATATLVAAQTTRYEAPAFSAQYPTPSTDSKGVIFDVHDVTFTDPAVAGQKGQAGRYILITEKETAVFGVTYSDLPFNPDTSTAAMDRVLVEEIAGQKLTDVSPQVWSTTAISGSGARELSVSGTMPNGTKIIYYTRITCRGHRVWLTDVFYEANSTVFASQDAENFFNSIVIR
jgi:hypothetical protein